MNFPHSNWCPVFIQIHVNFNHVTPAISAPAAQAAKRGSLEDSGEGPGRGRGSALEAENVAMKPTF